MSDGTSALCGQRGQAVKLKAQSTPSQRQHLSFLANQSERDALLSLMGNRSMPILPTPYFQPSHYPDKPATRLDGTHILLVDDAPDNRVLVARILTLAGATVECAGNGLEGVQKGLQNRFDTILMDIQMPEMDGYEATRQLRESGFQRPILALTAHALREERERSLRSGCNDHLTKPVNRLLLLEKIAYFIEHESNRAF